MKHLLLFILLSALPHIRVMSQEINALELHLSSGKEVLFSLEERPVVTFEGEEFVFTTQNNEIRYESSNILKFSYKYVDFSSAVSKTNDAQTSILYKHNTLYISGNEPKSKVSVYSLNGTLVSSIMTDANGSATIQLPHKSKNVYVVKTSISNFKISIK